MQLAFTLAFRLHLRGVPPAGHDINAFRAELSFFFSNGTGPEYAVMGRVARRLWAKALKRPYGADERSQMLKYHIQTSGRSLHAQDIDFNDIRTTLQALYAIYDNCNSLHTTTPTTRPSPRPPRKAAAAPCHPAHHQQGARPGQDEGTPAGQLQQRRAHLTGGAMSSTAPPSAVPTCQWYECVATNARVYPESLITRRYITAHPIISGTRFEVRKDRHYLPPME
ncbi:MAG: methylmalonyl-CoA mutase family protein [Flavobacteriales bacterium]